MIGKFHLFKHYVWIVLLVVLFCINTQHLCFSQSRSSIGIKAGTGFSRYFFLSPPGTVRVEFSQSYVPVFQTGIVFSQINDNKKGINPSLQIELNYIQKAWEQIFNDQNIKYTVFMDNIELPLLTHFRFGKKKNSLMVNAGLHFSYAYNVKIDSMGTSIKRTEIEYDSLEYHPFDYGLDAGIGYEFGRDNGVVVVQLMFSQGLKNYINRADQDPLVIYRSLNQSLFLSCIYKIPLRKKKQAIPK